MCMKTVYEIRAATILYNLARGDENRDCIYLVPANTCPVVPIALLSAGRKIEFIDIDPDTLCMDQEGVWRRCLDAEAPPVGSLVFIRTYGVETDMRKFFAPLKLRFPDIIVIDDRCAARPEPEVEKVDPQGADIILYSTGYAKYCDLGFGGFAHMKKERTYQRYSLTYRPGDLAEITDIYKTNIAAGTPISTAGETPAGFWKSYAWLDTGRPKVPWSEYVRLLLEKRVLADEHKAGLNSLYTAIIPDHVRFPDLFNRWRFQIRVADKNALLRKLKEENLFASDHYFPASFLFHAKECPEAELLHRVIVNLFNDFYINREQAGQVALIVRSHVLAEDGSNVLRKNRCRPSTGPRDAALDE